jgi:nucleotide-binding universal stress UspA family protein
VARERNADLVVLGVARGGALDPPLARSTLFHVVREARCPVLAVPVEASASTQAAAGVHHAQAC